MLDHPSLLECRLARRQARMVSSRSFTDAPKRLANADRARRDINPPSTCADQSGEQMSEVGMRLNVAEFCKRSGLNGTVCAVVRFLPVAIIHQEYSLAPLQRQNLIRASTRKERGGR
jgi:hypothetical protein